VFLSIVSSLLIVVREKVFILDVTLGQTEAGVTCLVGMSLDLHSAKGVGGSRSHPSAENSRVHLAQDACLSIADQRHRNVSLSFSRARSQIAANRVL